MRHRDHPAPLRGRTASRFPEQLRGKFGDRGLGRPRAARGACARPARASSRSTTREVGDLLVFASELKSVLASGLVDTELDYEAIDAYLTLGFVPGPTTPLRGVSQADARATGSSSTTAACAVEAYWAYPGARARRA